MALKQKLFDLSARNPLVNAKPSSLGFIEEQIDKKQFAKLYKKQSYLKKEYGLETTLLVSHFIKWKLPHKIEFYTSPLIYQSVKLNRVQKISLHFDVAIDENSMTINPVLTETFKSVFNINLSILNKSVDEFIEDLKQKLVENGGSIKSHLDFNTIAEWQIITKPSVGIFNYKKSALAQDYNQLIENPNQALKVLLGDELSHKVNAPKLYLPESNGTQKNAIENAICNHTVIQGPPGTGKSHTITELIKQLLLSGKRILLVSEKKSALDVVFEKLENQNLEHLAAYFDSNKSQKKNFYKHLKKSIETKTHPQDSQTNINFKIDELDKFFEEYTDRLTNHREEIDGSILSLINYLSKNRTNDFPYDIKSSVPTYKVWKEYLNFLKEVEFISEQTFEVNYISELPFIHFNKSAFLENEPLAKIQARLLELESNFDKITKVFNEYNLNWSWKDLGRFSIAASLLQLANKSALSILDPGSKKYKSFDNWTKKYELTENRLVQLDALVVNWHVKPKLADIDGLISDVNDNRKGWFNWLKESKVKSAFKTYKGNCDNKERLKALTNLKDWYDTKSKFAELEIKLKHNLGLLNPKVDINHILQLRQKLEGLSSNTYMFLLEHEKSIDLIKSLHELHPKLQQSNQIIKFLFVYFNLDDLTKAKEYIVFINKVLPRFRHVLPEIKKFLNLPYQLVNFLKHNSYNVQYLTDLVVYNSYVNEMQKEPILKKLESLDILPNYRKLKELRRSKNKEIQRDVREYWQNVLKANDNLLMAPISKLNQNEKEKRKQLKLAKRVIYHELAKQQRHLPVKDLIKQTEQTIFDYQPLWLINPLTIAESMPCEKDFFDVVIFDEASQIPLEDAIPAIYRSKQLVVVGDSKQMPPSQFFSASAETISLLDQSNFNLNSKLLTWHYRSEHPRLIEFSNHNFYDNELSYFPSNKDLNPIEHIHVKGGVFDNGENILEANEVIEQYLELIKQGFTNVGIIAFSQQQEKLISKILSKHRLVTNPELLIRNLENSQGIERNVMIISVGYGYNNEGVFKMNFGPLNQDFGSNRLNVLLTRAKQRMVVVSSVKSSDFKLSINRGVQLLQEFLRFCEGENNQTFKEPDSFILKRVSNLIKEKRNVNFLPAINGQAVNCFVDYSSEKVLLIDPTLHTEENKDIYTILDVLSSRFKAVKVLLSHDLLNDQERFDNDVMSFFT